MAQHPKVYAVCIFGLNICRVGTSHLPQGGEQSVWRPQVIGLNQGIDSSRLRPYRPGSGLVVRHEISRAGEMEDRIARFTQPP